MLMVILMSVIVTPFGVLAAIYLNEIAHQGPLTRLVRIGVRNLAGVPSIVYGVFGLGCLCTALVAHSTSGSSTTPYRRLPLVPAACYGHR